VSTAPARDSRPTGRRHVFVYYRVPAAHAGAAIEAARRMQWSLRQQHAGLQAAVMRRPVPAEGTVTVMETYARDAAEAPGGVDEALQRDIDAHAALAMAAWTVGPRHAEVFDACA
jgi:uncharacterized protein with NRDE domain